MGSLKTLKVDNSAYDSVITLRDKLRTTEAPYSISDVIIVSALLTDILLKEHPEFVREIANTVRSLRFKLSKRETNDIYDKLVSEYQSVSLYEEQKKRTVEEVIELLLNKGHVEVAEDLLFSYRGTLGDGKFKELSVKILEKKVLWDKNVG